MNDTTNDTARLPASATRPSSTSPESQEAARSEALKFLLQSRTSKEGWFSYTPEGDCSLEATAWSLLALREDDKVCSTGLDYLAASQNSADGGWSTKPGAGRSDWTSGPVLLCLRLLSSIKPQSATNKTKEAVTRGMYHLLDSRVEFFRPTARLLLLMAKGPQALAYPRGWPWDPKCFHWIEPTSYCLLALKLPDAPTKDVQRQMIKLAEQFITDHACQGGGWNHGNDLTLGSYLRPYRLTTAEALLALQDLPREAKIDQALTYLIGLSKQDSSSLSLALSILALTAYDQPCDQELSFLLSRQAKDGSFGPTTLTTAMAALALEAAQGTKVLKMSQARARS